MNRSWCLALLFFASLAGLGMADAGNHGDTKEESFRNVYLPAEELQVLLEARPGTVLPRAEFLELWRLAQEAGPAEPNEILIRAGRFEGGRASGLEESEQHAGEQFRIRGTLEITKRGENWARIPLGRGLAILSAKLDGQPALLGAANGIYLFLQEPGEHRLELELASPLIRTMDQEATTFELPPVVGTLELAPVPGRSLRVNGQVIATTPHQAEASEPIRVAIGGRPSISLQWTATEEDDRDPLIHASIEQLAQLGPGESEYRALIEVEVLARPVETLALRLPAGLRVTRVMGRDLAQWEVRDGNEGEAEGGQTIELRFATKFAGKRSIEVDSVGPALHGVNSLLPLLQMENAFVVGHAEVRADPTLRVWLEGTNGRLRPANPQYPDGIRVAYWRPDAEVRLAVLDRTRALGVGLVSLVDIDRARISLSASLTLQPHDGDLFDLLVSLPNEWNVQGVTWNGEPLSYQRAEEEGTQLLRLDLPAPVASGSSAQLQITAIHRVAHWTSRGTFRAPLPEVRVRDAAANAVGGADAGSEMEIEGLLLLRSADEVLVQTTELSGLTSVPVGGIPNADAQVRLALRYRSTGFAGEFEVREVPTQTSVESHRRVHLANGRLKVDDVLVYQIRGRGTDEIRFDLAADPREMDVGNWTGKGIIPDWNGSGAVIRSTSVEALENGVHRWRLMLDREVTGSVGVRVYLERPAAEGVPIEVPILSVPNASRMVGTIAITGEADQAIHIDTENLRAVDPVELALLPLAGRLVGSYRYRSLPYRLELRSSRFEPIPLISAVVPRMMLATTVDASGEIRHRANLSLMHHGLGMFRFSLEEATLLSAQLDGIPVEVRREGQNLLIALNAPDSKSKWVNVVLVYEETQPVSDPWGRGTTLRPRAPKLEIPVQQAEWTVHVPEEWLLVSLEGSPNEVEPNLGTRTGTFAGELRDLLFSLGQGRFFDPLHALGSFGLENVRYAAQPKFGENFVTAPSAESLDSLDVASPAPPAPADKQTAERKPLQLEGATIENLAGESTRSPRERAEIDEAHRRERLNREGAARPQGLLSMSLPFEPIGRTFFLDFEGTPDAKLNFIDQRASRRWTLLVAALVLFAGWSLRRFSRFLRVSLWAGLFVLAVGAAPLVPLIWVFALDGLLLGMIWVGLLAVLLVSVQVVVRGVRSIVGKFRSADTRSRTDAFAPLVLFGMLTLFGPSWAKGTEPDVPSSSPSSPLLKRTRVEPSAVSPAAEATPATNAAGVVIPTEALKERTGETTVFIPFEKGEHPFEADRVFLDQATFDRLWQQAHPDKVPASDPDAEWAIASLLLEGSVGEEFTSLTLRAKVHLFRDGTVLVPLPVQTDRLVRLRVDGEDVGVLDQVVPLPGPQPRNAPASPRLALPMRGLGRHTVEAAFSVPIEKTNDRGSVRIELVPAASSMLVLQLPDDGLTIEPAPRSGLTAGWTLEGRELRAPLQPGLPAALSWRPAPITAPRDLVATASHQATLDIQPAGVHQHLVEEIEIHQGQLRELRFALPAPWLVESIAPEIGSAWHIVEEGEGEQKSRVLRIRFASPLEKRAKVSLQLFAPRAVDDAGVTVSLGAVVPLGMQRVGGVLSLEADPSLRVNVTTAGNLRPEPYAALDRVPRTSSNRSAPVAASTEVPVGLMNYRFDRVEYELTLEIRTREAPFHVQLDATARVERDRIRQRSVLAIRPTAGPLTSVRIRLPEDFHVDTAESGPGVILRRIEEGDEGKGRSLLECVTLDGQPIDKMNPRYVGFTVAIEGWQTRMRDVHQPRIAFPEALASTSTQGQILVELAPGLAGQMQQIEGLAPDRVQPSAAGLARFGFRVTAPRASVVLGLRTLEPRVRATAATVVSLRDTGILYAMELRWTIAEASVRRLRFQLPAWLGEDARIEGVGVRQVDASAEAEGWRSIDISLDREVLGDYYLHVMQTLPIPDEGVFQSPGIRFEGVDSAESYILLENRSTDPVDRVPEVTPPHEMVTPSEVPMPLTEAARRQAIESIRLQDPAQEMAWRVRSAEQVEQLTAQVLLAEVRTVVAPDGGYRAQAEYRVANRMQQFLALRMPAGATLWTARVNEQPVRPSKVMRGGVERLLVPLPRATATDFSASVVLVYEGRLHTSGWLYWRWDIPAPEVLDLNVAETQWTVFLPKQFQYGFFRTNLEPAEENYLELSKERVLLREALGLVLSGASLKSKKAFDNVQQNLVEFESNVLDASSSYWGRVYYEESTKAATLRQQNREQAQELRSKIQQLATEAKDVESADIPSYFAPPEPPPPAPMEMEEPESLLESPGTGRGPRGEETDRRKSEKEANQYAPERGRMVRDRLREGLGDQAQEQLRQVQQQPRFEPNVQQAAEPMVPPPQQEAGAFRPSDSPQKPDTSWAAPALSASARRESLHLEPLPIELSNVGNRYAFVGAGGTARLAVPVIPVVWSQMLVGILWFAICVVLVAVVGQFALHRQSPIALRYWPWATGAIGLVMWIGCLLSGVGFFVFLVSLLILATRGIIRYSNRRS